MARFSLSSLRTRLLLLAVIAVVPALALIISAGLEQRRHAATDAQRESLMLARSTAAEYGRDSEGIRQLLIGLAQAPFVWSPKPGRCDSFFADLLKRFPSYANVALAGLDGNVVCSGLPFPRPVNIKDRTFFQKAVQTRDFAVGEYQIGRITGRAELNFGYPVLNAGGDIRAVVFAALDLNRLIRVAAEAYLPAGSTVTLLDGSGKVLARRPDPQRLVGQILPEAALIRAAAAEKGEGTIQLAGLDNRPHIYAIAPLRGLSGGGITCVVAIPTRLVFTEADRLLVRNLVGLGIVGLLTLVLAWVGADVFVLRQVNALTRTAQKLSDGDMSARTGMRPGSGELSRLAGTFDHMAASVERHLAAQKQAEDALRRVNLLLRTMSESNQALVCARDEVSLLHQICQIVVEVGGYRLAWVGVPDQDQNKSIRPVAQWGYEAGYLETLNLSWTEREREDGPTGRAIRTGQPILTKDILTDPRFAPWRAEAVKRGYVSSLALPIRANGEILGALSVYAAEANRFDEEEIKLLSELSDDLAYGIESLRTRVARQLADTERAAHAHRLEVVRAITTELTRELDLTTLLQLIVREAVGLVGADSGMLRLLDADGQTLVPHAWTGYGTARPDLPLALGEGASGTAARRRAGLCVNDFRTSPYATAALLEATTHHAVLAEPLLYRERLLGVINVNLEEAGRPFTPADQEMLTLFASQAAIAIENARLYEETRRHAAALEERVAERTAALERANRELAAASQHKSAFLANMSHEIRTPLNSVLGFAQVLQLQTANVLSEKHTRFLNSIYSSGLHLLSLINDILDLSKVEAGKISLRPQPLPVASTVEDVLVIARGLANKKSQTIEVDIAPDLPSVPADPVRFKQILFNLLSNAVKFTPESGRITLTARTLVEAPGRRGAEAQGDTGDNSPRHPGTPAPRQFLEIAVTDTGIGIEAEDLPKLFQEFVQLDAARNQSHEGTGLGLALTKRLVELHGGRIWATSAGEGQGSMFTVLLPFAGSGV